MLVPYQHVQVLVQHQHVHVVLCAGARPYLISLTSNGAEDSSMRRYDPDKYWENMHFCFVLHFQNKRLDKIKKILCDLGKLDQSFNTDCMGSLMKVL